MVQWKRIMLYLDANVSSLLHREKIWTKGVKMRSCVKGTCIIAIVLVAWIARIPIWNHDMRMPFIMCKRRGNVIFDRYKTNISIFLGSIGEQQSFWRAGIKRHPYLQAHRIRWQTSCNKDWSQRREDYLYEEYPMLSWVDCLESHLLLMLDLDSRYPKYTTCHLVLLYI